MHQKKQEIGTSSSLGGPVGTFLREIPSVSDVLNILADRRFNAVSVCPNYSDDFISRFTAARLKKDQKMVVTPVSAVEGRLPLVIREFGIEDKALSKQIGADVAEAARAVSQFGMENTLRISITTTRDTVPFAHVDHHSPESLFANSIRALKVYGPGTIVYPDAVVKREKLFFYTAAYLFATAEEHTRSILWRQLEEPLRELGYGLPVTPGTLAQEWEHLKVSQPIVPNGGGEQVPWGGTLFMRNGLSRGAVHRSPVTQEELKSPSGENLLMFFIDIDR